MGGYHKWIFCNIGWMARYQGLRNQPDKIVGGGRWIDENQHGAEVCNFVGCDDGNVYGHVETVKGKVDRAINIDALGALPHEGSVSGVTVVWTARNPDTGGRWIIGWYRNATVFRKRQPFGAPPSAQHKKDEISDFRVMSKSGDSVLLSIEERKLPLGSGKEWMGHTPWWFPALHVNPETSGFLRRIERLFDGHSIAGVRSNFGCGTAPEQTAKETSVLARIGQDRFSNSLFREWVGCSVTGCTTRRLLQASHIKPWSKSTDIERLDPNNGLLLYVGLHAAFDAGLITFSDTGELLVSLLLSVADRQLLGLRPNLKLRRPLGAARKGYLRQHRKTHGAKSGFELLK